METKTQHKSSKISCNLLKIIDYGNEITDEYAGEIICNSCGAVLEEKTPSYEINEKEEIGF